MMIYKKRKEKPQKDYKEGKREVRKRIKNEVYRTIIKELIKQERNRSRQ